MLSIASVALWAFAHSLSAGAEIAPPPGAALVPARQDPGPTEPKWTGSVTAGAILGMGNSETRTYNATADAEYRRAKDRVTLGFLTTSSEEKNTTPDWTTTDRRTSAKAKYDYFLSEKAYAFVQSSADTDRQASVDLRWTAGVGGGRQFRDDKTWKISAEAGVTYFNEEFKTGVQDDYISARGAYNVEWKANETWVLGQTTEVFPSLEDSEDIYVKADTRAKVSLTESMFGQIQWILDYDNTPAAGKDRVDHRVLLSVGWKF
jgi:putative salt-induced outer membrane protein YdiY